MNLGRGRPPPQHPRCVRSTPVAAAVDESMTCAEAMLRDWTFQELPLDAVTVGLATLSSCLLLLQTRPLPLSAPTLTAPHPPPSTLSPLQRSATTSRSPPHRRRLPFVQRARHCARKDFSCQISQPAGRANRRATRLIGSQPDPTLSRWRDIELAPLHPLMKFNSSPA